MTILCVIGVAALICSILSLMGKCPVSVPVLLLSICEVLRCLPMGR